MASANKSRWIYAAAAVTPAAVLNWFGNGLNPLWPLMWIAMLPVLWFALESSPAAAGIVAAASILLGALNMWQYLHVVLGAPASVWFSVYAVAAIAGAAAVVLFRALALKGHTWLAALSYPAAWTACEYLRNLVTPHGSAGSLAYSQLSFLPFLQLASITGPWGMTFVMLFFQSTLAIAIYLWRTNRKQALRIASGGVGLTATVIAFGALRLTQPQGAALRVGLISSDQRPYATVTDPGPSTEQLFSAYAAQAENLAAQGAQAIVMPEKLAAIVEPDTSPMDNILQSTADKTGATVVAGVVRISKPLLYNEARIYVPHAPIASYDKQHMLPPYESKLEPGKSLTLLPQAHKTIGVAICKDMDFSRPARSYGQAGTGVMLVPAWDFVVDDAWHGHIAIMRGVEDGFSIVRSAKAGFLTVSDSRGRILSETRSSSAPFATLLANVPTEHHATLYQDFGDWFAWLALATLVVALVGLLRTPKPLLKSREAPAPATQRAPQ